MRKLLVPDEASALAVEGLALEILAELSREIAPPPAMKPPRWLRDVRDVLHARYAETLTHDELGKLGGVHPVHLATVFRRHFGCTLGEYVRRLRIAFAARELAETGETLYNVGLAAGFADQSHFSKVFKQQTGLTPGQFRARLRA